MSQVFSADSVNNTGVTTIVTTAETAGVTGNFLTPPFGNAKAIVSGVLSVIVGSGVTAVALKLRRNPNAENVVIGTQVNVTVAAGNTVTVSLVAADAIPDGRAVQYQLTVTCPAATGNGSIQYANISALLISG